MKSFIKNITDKCSVSELVYWWILRLLMVGGIIYSIIFKKCITGGEYLGSAMPIQMAANLTGMFAYEIIQLFPKSSKFRYMSPYFQNITATGFFLGSFGGAFLNFYYIIPGYDKILHAFGTAEAVFIGYEFVVCIQKKLKTTCHFEIVCLCALGFGFILSCGWELFEFTYDQICLGDAQHWNYANALASVGGDASKVFNLIPPRVPERFALMDTMDDMILNVIGAVPMYLILRAKPYLHKGKNDVNKQITDGLI